MQRHGLTAPIDDHIDLAILAHRRARLLERGDALAVDRDDHVAGREAGGAERPAAVAARGDDEPGDPAVIGPRNEIDRDAGSRL